MNFPCQIEKHFYINAGNNCFVIKNYYLPLVFRDWKYRIYIKGIPFFFQLHLVKKSAELFTGTV